MHASSRTYATLLSYRPPCARSGIAPRWTTRRNISSSITPFRMHQTRRIPSIALPRQHASQVLRRVISTAEVPFASSPQPPSTLNRTLRFLALSIFFTMTGFAVASAPGLDTIKHLANPPTDADTLKLFKPTDDVQVEVDRRINAHSLTKKLRENSDLIESRPHLKMPREFAPHNLTGGTLAGPGRIVVPPYMWIEKEGKHLTSISYLGVDVCGHPGVVHGGLLATMLDEGLARCCFPAMPNKIAMTANLNVNYRKPAPAGAFFVLKAKTVKVEGRKAWVEGHIETLVEEGEEPVILANATALFIEPRNAASMARIYPPS